MEYRHIEGVDKPVSRILFGTAQPPFMQNGDDDALLDAVLAMGVNAFDIARQYMRAEDAIGRWVNRRGIRDQVVLLSKCGHPNMFGKKRVNAKDMQKDLQASLQHLQTDYIDIYLLHRDDPDTDVAVPVETFNEMHAAGKIGAFGGSNWTHRRIEAANEYAYKHGLVPFTVSSPNFGLAEQVRDPWGGGCVTISGDANLAARAWYAKNQMPVIAYSSLGRGFFSGKLRSTDERHPEKVLDAFAVKGYVSPENFARLSRCETLAAEKGASVPQIAMAWIYAQAVNTFAVVSSSKAARMQQNADALSIHLTKEEAAYLDLKAER